MSELLEKHRWVGEFFSENDYENRFVGEIEYSPEDGVTLSYSITGVALGNKSSHLHGVLSSGEKCTLLGEFDPKASGLRFKNGLTTRNGRVGFQCLILGDFLSENELLYNINFSLAGMQEFFFPAGQKDLISYSETPLYTINTKYGRLTVGNNANFGSFEVTSQIYSRDKDAEKKLREQVASIEADHPEANFMLKKDIAYRINLHVDDGADMQCLYKHISDIADFFSLLVFGPVYPVSIRTKKTVQDSAPLDIFPSMLLERRVIERSQVGNTHYSMPIVNSAVKLDDALATWLESPVDFATLVSAIQKETGYRVLHEVHGAIVLYGTQLEAISYEAAQSAQKYQYPLDTYAISKVRSTISAIFSSVNISDTGVGISALRNEIAHVGRPKKILPKMTLAQLVDLEHCLQITVIGYILSRLGIDKSLIDIYQDKLTR